MEAFLQIWPTGLTVCFSNTLKQPSRCSSKILRAKMVSISTGTFGGWGWGVQVSGCNNYSSYYYYIISSVLMLIVIVQMTQRWQNQILFSLYGPPLLNSKLTIALVNNFFYPDSKFLTTHLHHHYSHNPLCDGLGNVHHRDIHCTSKTFSRHC